MNDGHVIELMRALGMMWPTVPVQPSDADVRVRVWQHVLADIDYAEAFAVAVEYSRTGVPFPPAPGLIAERALSLREQVAGTYAPDADQAVAEVMAGIRHGGLNLLDPRRDPRHEWSHPAVAAAVRAMGWRDMCMSDKPDVVRSQFLRVYADARARHVTEQRRTPAVRALMAPGRPEIPTTTTGDTNDTRSEPAGPAELEPGDDDDVVVDLVEPGRALVHRRARSRRVG